MSVERSRLFCTLGLVIASVAISCCTVSLMPRANAQTVTVNQSSAASHSEDERTLRAQAAEYIKAFAAGDAKALANMWAPEGTYTDPYGEQFRGRASIEKFFAEGFKRGGAEPLEINIDSFRFPADNIAIEEGSCKIVKGPDAGTTTNYRVVHVKDKTNGTWLMESVSETSPRPATSKLDDISWILGNWTAKGPNGSIHFAADWTANHKFIRCVYGPDNVNAASVQVIGWNPRQGKIASWHFDGSGGFGFGTWSQDGDSWAERTSGVEPDGAASHSTNVIRKVDANTFTWRSFGRTVAGVPVADRQEVTVVRDRSDNK